ncbi:MAG: helix-turn-helix domain-containing protein [Chitinophagaceae bacterium]
MDTPLAIVTRKAPAALLKPYISEYVFRIMEVPEGQSIKKSMPLRYVSSIDFFLGDEFKTYDCNSGLQIPFSRCTVRGLRTFQKTRIVINGHFVSFTIRFKPVGLYGLLGIPALHFCNEAIEGSSLSNHLFAEITEQLMACTSSIDCCVAIAEPYMLQMAGNAYRNIHISAAVEQMARLITAGNVPVSIAQLQQQVCLSKRQLERNFVKEVGITPKLYSRMVRFSNALKHRRDHADTKWASLAYEFDYADQTHLIKDFQQFLGVTPGGFCAEDFAF